MGCALLHKQQDTNEHSAQPDSDSVGPANVVCRWAICDCRELVSGENQVELIACRGVSKYANVWWVAIYRILNFHNAIDKIFPQRLAQVKPIDRSTSSNSDATTDFMTILSATVALCASVCLYVYVRMCVCVCACTENRFDKLMYDRFDSHTARFRTIDYCRRHPKFEKICALPAGMGLTVTQSCPGNAIARWFELRQHNCLPMAEPDTANRLQIDVCGPPNRIRIKSNQIQANSGITKGRFVTR